MVELAEGPATWAIPGRACTSFLATVTHPRICAPPAPLARALDHVEAWLESPTLALLTESAAHWPTLRALLAGGRIAGVQAHDARVAVLCRQHGVRERWSADRDSSRFARLAVVTRWSARDRREEMPHAN